MTKHLRPVSGTTAVSLRTSKPTTLGARIWVNGNEYVVEKMIKQLAMEAERGVVHRWRLTPTSSDPRNLASIHLVSRGGFDRLQNRLHVTKHQMIEHSDVVENKARPERFELPTLWFEDRCKAFLKFTEFPGFNLLSVEAVAVVLLVSVEVLGSSR